MKVKSFQEHLNHRLNPEDIAEIEAAAKLEYDSLKALQNDISKVLIQYMTENDMGFNDVVRRLGKSPTQVSKIIKGDTNLTLATVAQLFAMMGKHPHITVTSK